MGGYIAYVLILLFTGRTYYWTVLKAALTRKGETTLLRESVIAARVFILASLLMVILLVNMGLPIIHSIFYVLIISGFFLVFTRIICETGIPFLQSFRPETGAIDMMGIGFFGVAPGAFLIMLSGVFTHDPRESLMPYVATGFKVADDMKVKKIRLLGILSIGLIAAIIIGLCVSFFTAYKYGGVNNDGYASLWAPKGLYNQVAQEMRGLDDNGQLENAIEPNGISERLSLLQIGKGKRKKESLFFFCFGFIMVLIFAFCRFRFKKFPLHPVMFLVMGAYALRTLWFSILIGFLIKFLVIRFGGGKAVEKLKPLMIGLILGELIAAAFFIILAALVFMFQDGKIIKSIMILPG
ncbi:MAG: hypothetical protein HRT89_23510, partial [Lentisphaeria bacterium]|nr:hypothetical protein [Lentisphaeria bacterium]NQZ71029.1 hypothetical protein [Lentisphaeria bacterium]